MKSAGRNVFAMVAGVVLLSAASHPVAGAASADAAAAQGAYKQIPLRRDADEADIAWGLVGVVGVAVVLVVARAGRTGGRWPRRGLVAWRKSPSLPPRVQVIERRGLNAACTLYLVRWDNEEVLLACAAQGVSLIARRSAGPSPPGET